VLYVLGATVLGWSTIPTGTGDILRSARTHGTAVSWIAEQRVQVNVVGQSQSFDSQALITADPTRNAFQALVLGRAPQTISYVSDGVLTLRSTAAQQLNGTGWKMLTNPCKGQLALKANLLAPVTPDDLLASSHPKLLTANGNFTGLQAWIFSFTPTPAELDQLLLLPYLDRAEPGYKNWTISPADRASIATGHYTVTSALAWVTRSPRKLQLLQIGMRLPSHDVLTLRETISGLKVSDPFKGYSLHSQACSK
jgi:hypothetical protein